MLAPRGDIVAGRKFFDKFDVGREAGAGENAFKQIVAQHRVVGDAPLERGFERVDVIDALAGEGPFAEQVLVDVGYGGGIGVESAGAGEYPLVDRAFAR